MTPGTAYDQSLDKYCRCGLITYQRPPVTTGEVASDDCAQALGGRAAGHSRHSSRNSPAGCGRLRNALSINGSSADRILCGADQGHGGRHPGSTNGGRPFQPAGSGLPPWCRVFERFSYPSLTPAIPPSTASSVPVVADDNGLARYAMA